MTKIIKLLCVSALALTAIGCQSASGPGGDSGNVEPVAFTETELQTFLTGKTYPMGGADLSSSRGAFYFGESGRLLAEWEGQTEESTWSVADGSRFCYDLDMFGGSECVKLLKNPETGGYIHVFDGNRRILDADAIVEGNQI